MMESTLEIKLEDIDLFKDIKEEEMITDSATDGIESNEDGNDSNESNNEQIDDAVESMDSCDSVETIEFVEPRDPIDEGVSGEGGDGKEVSEKKNACLPLLSSDEEGESADLHQCGHCKLMFSNLTKYITHKIQKVCWLDQRANNNHRDELVWSPRHRVGSLSPDDTNGHKEDDNGVTPTKQDEPDNINQTTEAEIRKHHNVYGQAGNSPRNDDDCKSPSTESVSAEDDKLNSDNNNNGEDKQREEGERSANENSDEGGEGDEEKITDNNNGIDFKKKDSRGDTLIINQSEIDLNSLNGASRDHVEQAVSSPRHSFNGSPRNADIPHSHSSNTIEPMNKYDRLTPNLPPIMSTRGSNRGIDNFYSVEKTYQGSRGYPNGRQPRPDDKPRALEKVHRAVYDRRDERYSSYGRYEQPRYEAETESTWTSSYLDRKPTTSHPQSYKTSADYYSSRERLTTMVGLDTDYKRNGSNEEYDKSIKIEAIEKESASNMPPELVDERIVAAPPDLVRVEPSDAAENNILHKKFTGEILKSEDNDETSRGPTALNSHLEDSLDDDGAERPKFMEVSSPDKDIDSPLNSATMPELDGVKENLRESVESQLMAHHRLSESAVEQLITVPVSGSGDPSWKHAKQVYSCPLCAKVFPFKSKLQRHVLVHTRIKPYKCTVCGRGFTQQIDLQRHLTRHTGEKPFKCHLCTAQFIRADNLRKHCKDAHYVVIEEPIRKRRRRTTGSDTVLPSLEVAIALAFSETERNGGRVLGRTVTRANPRTPSGSTTTSENFNNKFSQQKPSSDVTPFIGEHHTAMFSQSSSRYPGPPPEDIKGGGLYEQRKPPNEPFGGDDKEPFSPGRKGYLPREMPRLYENGGHQGRGGYMPPPEYEREYRQRDRGDRESQDYMLYRDNKDRRQLDPRGPPPGHMTAEERYKMEYRPLSSDGPAPPPPRGMVYRRPGGGDEKDYRRRYPDPRMGPEDIDPRDKYSMYNQRTSGGTARSPDPRGPYDHPSRRPIEMREMPSRSQIDDYESKYRYSKSYTRIDPSDPGEYVSMATDKDDEPKIRSSYGGEDDIRHSAKNGEFIKSSDLASSQYAEEEEIPIVTMNEELPGSLEPT